MLNRLPEDQSERIDSHRAGGENDHNRKGGTVAGLELRSFDDVPIEDEES
jgi:hypothetical protein